MNAYLGDGLYVSFDGTMFRVYSQDDGNEVYLDPATLDALNSFVAKIAWHLAEEKKHEQLL